MAPDSRTESRTCPTRAPPRRHMIAVAESGESLFADALHCRIVCRVGNEPDGRYGECCRQLISRSRNARIDVDESHGSSLAGESFADRPADTLGAADDNGGIVADLEIHLVVPRRHLPRRAPERLNQLAVPTVPSGLQLLGQL